MTVATPPHDSPEPDKLVGAEEPMAQNPVFDLQGLSLVGVSKTRLVIPQRARRLETEQSTRSTYYGS